MMNGNAKTPLCKAILVEDPKRSYNMVHSLLESGEDPNLPDEGFYNTRPLYLAWGEETVEGKNGLVKLLIEHGALAHPEDKPLDDILMCTAPLETTLSIFRLGHSFMEYLTESEQEALCTDNPLSYLLGEGRFDVIEAVMEFDLASLLNAFDIGGETVLAEMARDGKIEQAKWLIDHDVDVNASSKIRIGNTPLDYAVQRQDLEMVRFLLDAGANPNIPTWMSITAVLRAESEYQNGGSHIAKEIVKLVAEASKRFSIKSD